ncbi:MAG: ABC transporter permease [bacterium]|nr:ABC transporter permease [bacterium]
MLSSVALIRRELLDSATRMRTLVILVCSVGLASAPAVVHWLNLPSEVTAEYFMSGGISRAIVGQTAAALLAGCALFITGMAALSLTEERESGTLDDVRMSLIRPIGLVAAKCLNAVAFFVLVIIATLPAVATVFFLVGLEWDALIQAFGIVLASCFMCAAAGLAAAAFAKDAAPVLIWSYAGALLLLCNPVASALRLTSSAPASHSIAAVLSPLFAIRHVLDGRLTWPEFAMAIGVQIGTALALIGLAAYLIARGEPRRVRWNTAGPRSETFKRLMDRVLRPRKRRGALEEDRNPVFLKEVYWGWGSASRTLVLVFYGTLVLFLAAAWFLFGWPRSYVLAYQLGLYGDEAELRMWLLLQMTLVLLVGPIFAANLVAKEHREGSMDFLRLSLLDSRVVFSGKAFAAMLPVIACVAAVALADGIVYQFIMNHARSDAMLTGFLTTAVCGIVGLSLTLLAMALAKRMSSVLGLSLVFAGLFGGVVYWLVSKIAELWAGDPSAPASGWGRHLVQVLHNAVSCLSPMALFFNNWGKAETTLYTAHFGIGIAVQILFCVLVVVVASRAFRRRHMVDS